MYLVLYGNKDSYDNPICIEPDGAYKTSKESGEHLQNILISWLTQNYRDDILLEKCDFDYELYSFELIAILKKKITKAIKNKEHKIMYNEYNGYKFDMNEYGELTMITTGCPSVNSYDGETYQVIHI